MVKNKYKFGKRVTYYLSYDAINKLSKICKNKSSFIEMLIFKEFENVKKKKEKLEDNINLSK